MSAPPLADGEPAVEFHDVRKAFDDRVVLDGVTLSIPAGRTTVIIGPSGVGKSVFLKLLIGLIAPDSGEILVEGQDITRLSERELYALRRRIGMLFQDGALFDSLTVGENVAFPLRRHTRMSEDEIAGVVAEKLQAVGLPGTEERMPSELSGGMRKRVGLARAIALDPDIVLFDEPNSGLDPMTSDAIDALIVEMRRKLGKTFVVISHDIVGTFRVADRIAMLYGGRLIAHGTPEELRRSTDPIVRRFLARNLVLPPLAGEAGRAEGGS